MKLLPCQPRRGPRCRGHAWFGDEPAMSGRYQDSYKCTRCRNVTFLPLAEYNGLPTLTIDIVKAKAERDPKVWGQVLRMFRRDFEGMGLSSGQADDLLRAGYKGAEELHPR